MKKNIIIVLLSILIGICLLITGLLIGLNLNQNDRFQIYESNFAPTIKLDKKTGNTMRNVNCDNKDEVPNCWEPMDNDINIGPLKLDDYLPQKRK